MAMTVSLPEPLAAVLEAEAARRGQSPDEVAADLLAGALPRAVPADPVEAFIGVAGSVDAGRAGPRRLSFTGAVRSSPAAGPGRAYAGGMSDDRDDAAAAAGDDQAAVRELPSFTGVADSGDGTLSVRVDEILYGEPASADAA
jgi:hypothetical protein